MQIPDRPESIDTQGFVNPASFELVHEVKGDTADQFIARMIEGGGEEGAYVVDERREMVMKRFEDGI